MKNKICLLLILLLFVISGCEGPAGPPQPPPKLHTICDVQITLLGQDYTLMGITEGKKMVKFSVNWVVWHTLSDGVTVNLNYDDSGYVHSISYVNPCVNN